MAIETIQTEGDFVIKNGSGKAAFRFHAEDEAFRIYASQDSIWLTIGEAEELAGWLARRFQEAL